MTPPRDPPRYLDRRAGRNYTENPALALPNEPEAVSVIEQERQSANVRRAERDQLLLAWLQTSTRIEAALDHFETHSAPDRQRLHSCLRAVRRSTASVGRELGLSA